MAQFYDMIIYLRKRASLSQQQLADATGLTRSAISMYETGKREPDLETLEILADYFNVDMNTLTGKGSPATSCGRTPGVLNQKTENSPDELQLTEGETALIQLFRKIPQDKQRIVIEMIRAALSTES